MEVILGQPKWIITNHTKCQSSSKEGDVCIWWDLQGILYYELFLENQTIHSNKYCTQLDQLKAALKQKMHNLLSG